LDFALIPEFNNVNLKSENSMNLNDINNNLSDKESNLTIIIKKIDEKENKNKILIDLRKLSNMKDGKYSNLNRLIFFKKYIYIHA